MNSEPNQPDHPEQPEQPKKSKKLPLGTKKYPWYKVPEHYRNGMKIPARYYHYSDGGVWQTDATPPGCVKQDTSY